MSSSINQWVEHYGAIGVFLTAAAEGELGVLVGGTMVHLGKLSLVAVVIAAWMGSFVSTQAFFHLGRSQRDSRIVNKATKTRAFGKAVKWIDRQPHLFTFFYRFIYGFRVAGPIGISMSKIHWRTFMLINLASALLWGIGATMLGWWAGPGVARFLHNWFTWERIAIASVVVLTIGLLVVGWRIHTKRRKDGHAANESA
ncbi:MAG: DedA family protein [Sphingomicrobium sp.]